MTYKDLSHRINEIDIGTINPVFPSLTGSEGEKFEEIYRAVDQFVVRLAKFYLTVNAMRSDKLKEFQKFPEKR